jgi:multidrug efflux pump subunit AcrB
MLTRLSLANRAIVALVTVLLLGIGVWAASTMKQELIPTANEPSAVVALSQPGLSPATLDDQVVVPLSQSLAAISGVDKVTTTTSNGSAQLTVSWGFAADDDKILAGIRAATDGAVAQSGGSATAEVFAGGSADIPVLSLALTHDGPIETLADRVETVLVPAIEKIPGVRDARVSGRLQQQVLVTLDPAALAARSIEPATVTAMLETAGKVTPAGSSVEGSRSLAIEVGEEISSVADVEALPLSTLDGAVPLSQVATVTLADADQSSLARADGTPAIGLTITKTPESNAVEVSHAVTALVDAQLADLGDRATSHTTFDQSTLIESSIKDLLVEGGLGLAFAVLVILVFLLSPRATIITAISIPLSLLIAIIGLKVGGYSLNIFTLAALTAAVGRVVDDSIVVIENITRRRGTGLLTLAGVRTSVAQVAGAVTASTLTTVAVFLPIAFIGGVAGELFRPFAVAVTVALLGSLVVSLTIVPVLAYWFMRGRSSSVELGELESVVSPVAGPVASAEPDPAERTTRLQRAYLPALGFALRRPVTMILIACLALGGTVVAGSLLKTDFLGSFADARAVQVTQTMPLSATLEASDTTARELEKAVSTIPAVESYQTTVGSLGAPVVLDLVLAKDADPQAAIAVIRDRVGTLSGADDITVATQATETTSSTIDVIVTGTNEADLTQANDQIVDALGKLDEIRTVTTDLAAEQPVLKVSVDQSAAAAQGFSVAEIGIAIRAAVEGQTLGSVRVDGRTHDLVLRSQATESAPDAIGALPLPVSALQQQRTQKDAGDALARDQAQVSAQAAAEAQRSADRQLADLLKSSTQAARELAELQNQLATAIANPPQASDDPVTAGEIAALQHEQLVAQLQGAVESTRSSITALDEQISSARKAISDGAAQQAETDRLTQAQRDLEKVRASSILVRDVATVSVVDTAATITRLNGVRAVTVAATPTAGDLGNATEAVNRATASLTLPDTVTLAQDGAGEQQAESFTQLGLAMLIAIALVYIVLVATFRSLVQPLLLLVSVPLAATGAVIGLLVTGTPLGIPALIGMLMLIGIVVTNAIVLVDLINDYRRKGSSIDDAVTHGARLRLRPIIMTAAATIFALLPMAVGLTGGSGFISKSLAVVVIGGLVSSTILTLLLLPSLYALQERGLERRATRRGRRGSGRDAEPRAALEGSHERLAQ